MQKGKTSKKGIIAAITVAALLIIAVVVLLVVLLGRDPILINYGEEYVWQYNKPFGGEVDSFMTIDGKMDEPEWQGQNQLVHTEDGTTMTMTTLFTEKGLYIGLKATDGNVTWKRRHEYASNSSFKVVIVKENEPMPTFNNYGANFHTTRHAFLEIDTQNCRSYRQTPYVGKTYVEGEVNSGETEYMSTELFLTWEDLHYTQEELGADGMPETVEIYGNYRKIDDSPNTIQPTFMTEWQFETYYHFGKNGLIADYQSDVLGHAANGPVATDMWKLSKDADGNTVASASEERLQIIWFKNAPSVNFIAEAKIKPGETVQNINNRSGIVLYKDGSTYDLFGANGRLMRSGGLELNTNNKTDSYHWEAGVHLSQNLGNVMKTPGEVTLRVVKRGAYLFYFYDGVYWGYEFVDELKDACSVGVFTNGNAEFSNLSFIDYTGKDAELKEILSEYVYFVTTSGVKPMGTVSSDLEAVKHGDPIHVTISPKSGSVLTDFTINGADMYEEVLSKLDKGIFTYTPTCDVELLGTFTRFDKDALVETVIIPENAAKEIVHNITYQINGKNNDLLAYTGSSNSNGFIIVDLPKKGTYTVGGRTVKVDGTYNFVLTSTGYHTHTDKFTLNDNTTSINMDGEKESVLKDKSFTKKVKLVANGYGGTIVVNGLSVTTGGRMEYNKSTGNYYVKNASVTTLFKSYISSQYAMKVTLKHNDLLNGNNLSGIIITTGKGSVILKANTGNPGALIVAAGPDVGWTNAELAVNGFEGLEFNKPYGELSFTVVRMKNRILIFNNKDELKIVLSENGMEVMDNIRWGAQNQPAINTHLKNMWKAGPQNAFGAVKYGNGGSCEWDMNFTPNIPNVDAVKVAVTFLDGAKKDYTAVFGTGLQGKLDGTTSHEQFGVVPFLNNGRIDIKKNWDKYLLKNSTLEFRYDAVTTNKVPGTGISVSGNKVTLTGRFEKDQISDEFNPIDKKNLWSSDVTRSIYTKHTDTSYVLKATFTPRKLGTGFFGFSLWDLNSDGIVGIEANGNMNARSFKSNYFAINRHGKATPLKPNEPIEMTLVRDDDYFYLYVGSELRASFGLQNKGAWGTTEFGTRFGFALKGSNEVEISNIQYKTGSAAVAPYRPAAEGVLHVTYLDGKTATIDTIWDKGIQQPLKGQTSHKLLSSSVYLNNYKIQLDKGWDSKLTGNNTLEFLYDTSTTNEVPGTGISVSGGKITLTGRFEKDQISDEFNPIDKKNLWAADVTRSIFMKHADTSYVLKATFTPRKLGTGFFGFTLWDENSDGIVGIEANGNMNARSFKSNYFAINRHGKATPINPNKPIEMTLVRDNDYFYLYVGNELRASFGLNNEGAWGTTAFSTRVGFALKGSNEVEISNIQYKTGSAAVAPYRPAAKGVLHVTYLDGKTATINTIWDKGIQQPLKGQTSHKMLSSSVYLNNYKIQLDEGWDSKLTGTNTLEFRYDTSTTNEVPGTGISVSGDKVTLTGRFEKDQISDEFNPIDKKNLWSSDVTRSIYTKHTDTSYVLKATFTPRKLGTGFFGFTLWDENSDGIVGIEANGNMNARSFKSNYFAISRHGKATPINPNEPIEMTLVRDGENFYLYVGNELRASFGLNNEGAWGTTAFTTRVGFALKGNNEVEISNIQYKAGSDAVAPYLPGEEGTLHVTFLDGTTTSVATVWGQGIVEMPSKIGPFSHKLFSTSAYLNGYKIQLDSGWELSLTGENTLEFRYDTFTTNKVPGTGISVSGDMVTLTGRTDGGQYTDEFNPIDGFQLWSGSTYRGIWTNNTDEFYVLKATFKPTTMTNDIFGFGLWDENCMGVIGLAKDGTVHGYSHKVNAYTDIQLFGEATPIVAGQEIEMTLVRNGDIFWLYVGDEPRATFTSTAAGTWTNAKFSTRVGFGQVGRNVVEISDYSYASGEAAVKPYRPVINSSLKVTYLDGVEETICGVWGEGLEKELSGVMTHDIFGVSAYLNGKKVTLTEGWDASLSGSNTLEFCYDSFTTNKVSGTGISVSSDAITLTGRVGGGEYTDEFNPIDGNKLWRGNTSRGIWTNNTGDTYVLKATFKPTTFTDGIIGFGLWDENTMAILGVNKNGVVVGYSHKTSNYTGIVSHGTPKAIAAGEEVEMTLVRSGYVFYLYVEDELRATFTSTLAGTWLTGTFSTKVGFAQHGQNVVEVSSYSYASGTDAVAPYIPEEVKVYVTYLDGTKETLDAEKGVGLEKPLNGIMTHETFGVAAYLNGKPTVLAEGWDKNLAGTNILEFRYDTNSTNTSGAGITVKPDGKVTLTGNFDYGTLSGERNPVDGTMLQQNMVRRGIWLNQTGNRYVVKATYTPTRMLNGFFGFGFWDQNSMAVVGMNMDGVITAHSARTGSITIKNVGKPAPVKSGTAMEWMLVCDGSNYSLYVDNELRATFKTTNAGSNGTSEFSRVALAAMGGCVVDITNYSCKTLCQKHTPKTAAGRPATCQQTGLEGGVVCETCNAILEAPTILPKVAHNNQDGICKVCNKETWVQALEGKYVSVIGDSISTYDGISNNPAYRPEMTQNAYFYGKSWFRLEDTYWMQLINRFDMRLCVNNSWSGAIIDGGSSSGIYRADKLTHKNGTKPDVILVFMGINDLNSGFAPELTQERYTTMLLTIKKEYPDAQVFCLGMPNRLTNDDMVIAYNNAFIDAINEAGDNFHYVDLFNSALHDEVYQKNSTNDNLHPNATGMDYITDLFAAALQAHYGELTTQVTFTYTDGSEETIPATWGEGLAHQPTGPMTENMLISKYVNGCIVGMTKDWDKYLLSDTTIAYKADTFTTNTVQGTGIAVKENGTVVLTGRLDGGQYTDEFNPINNERLWAGNTHRAIWTANTETTYVLSATFKPTNFTGGAIGFGLWDQNSVATIGINRGGTIVGKSFKAADYKLTQYGTATPITAGEEVKMTLVRNGNNFYLYVNDVLRATFTTTVAGDWASAAFSTQVGFAQYGQNVVEVSNYTYTAGDEAVAPYLPEKEGTLNVTFLDGSTTSIATIMGEGLQQALTGAMTSDFFGYAAYLNGEQVALTEGWDKNLIGTNTLEFRYDSRTTNTVPGTGIEVKGDGTVVLTGRLDGGQYTDEFNPINNERLWAGNTCRTLWTTNTSDTYVLSATFKPTNFTGGAIGFGLWDQNSVATIGVTKTGAVFARSLKAADYKLTQYGTATPITVGEEVKLTLVRNGDNFYLLVDGELRATFTSTVAGAWASATFSTQVGFAQYGQNVVEISNYSYSTTLPTKSVTVTYPDGTSEKITAQWGVGLTKQPAEVNSVIYSMYLNDEKITDLTEATKHLVEDAVLTWKYDSRTTNVVPGTGIAVNTDGTIVLTGNMGSGQLADEINPLNNEKLWADSTRRTLWTTNTSDTYVLSATFKPTTFTGGVIGFGLWDQNSVAVIGVNRVGAIAGASFKASYYKLTEHGTATAVGEEVKLTLVRNGNNFYLYVNDVLRATFTTTVAGAWANATFSTKVGFAQYGQNIVEISNYTYASGDEAVAPYIPTK